jgi:hypothetical protein
VPRSGASSKSPNAAEGVFMKEHLQKGALLVALGIVVIVGGFIFAAAVLGLWLNSIGNLAP